MLRQDANLGEDEIKGYVKDNLANYKVPREIVFIDELPRNHTGKVLKRELKEHGADAESSQGSEGSEGETDANPEAGKEASNS